MNIYNILYEVLWKPHECINKTTDHTKQQQQQRQQEQHPNNNSITSLAGQTCLDFYHNIVKLFLINQGIWSCECKSEKGFKLKDVRHLTYQKPVRSQTGIWNHVELLLLLFFAIIFWKAQCLVKSLDFHGVNVMSVKIGLASYRLGLSLVQYIFSYFIVWR